MLRNREEFLQGLRRMEQGEDDRSLASDESDAEVSRLRRLYSPKTISLAGQSQGDNLILQLRKVNARKDPRSKNLLQQSFCKAPERWEKTSPELGPAPPKARNPDRESDFAALEQVSNSTIEPEPSREPAKLPLAELQIELERRGLPTSGRKGELVQRLQQAYRDEASAPQLPIVTEEEHLPCKPLSPQSVWIGADWGSVVHPDAVVKGQRGFEATVNLKLGRQTRLWEHREGYGGRKYCKPWQYGWLTRGDALRLRAEAGEVHEIDMHALDDDLETKQYQEKLRQKDREDAWKD